MAGGAEPQLAEAVTQVIKQVQDAHLEQLATKGDLVRLEARMDAGFAETKAEIIKSAHCPGRSHCRARQAAVTKLLRRHQAHLGRVVPSTRLSPH